MAEDTFSHGAAHSLKCETTEAKTSLYTLAYFLESAAIAKKIKEKTRLTTAVFWAFVVHKCCMGLFVTLNIKWKDTYTTAVKVDILKNQTRDAQAVLDLHFWYK